MNDGEVPDSLLDASEVRSEVLNLVSISSQSEPTCFRFDLLPIPTILPAADIESGWFSAPWLTPLTQTRARNMANTKCKSSFQDLSWAPPPLKLKDSPFDLFPMVPTSKSIMPLQPRTASYRATAMTMTLRKEIRTTASPLKNLLSSNPRKGRRRNQVDLALNVVL
jgi:hypothetical protein